MSARFRTAPLAGVLLLAALPALAQAPAPAPSRQTLGGFSVSNRLVLTGGVTSIEGAAGGGLTPWAVIGGMGSRDEIGATAFATAIPLNDYDFYAYGALIGIRDRVEISFARQTFDLNRVGGDLGLRNDFTINQNVVGVKVRLFGNLVLDQDSFLPQVAVGAFYKHNDRGEIVRSLGAQRHNDFEYYVSATKLILSQSILLNGTLRLTRANQFGLLGFGGDRNDDYEVMPEGSVAYLFSRTLAVGAEYRRRPDNLRIARERDAFDVFVAYQPLKNLSLVGGYAFLGQVATESNQRGFYLNASVGF
jgi:hypothetical protein